MTLPSSSALGPQPSALPSPDFLLNAQNIGISFGGLKAVQNFSMQIPRGDLFGLIGPNGAGKTTAFNLLTGVYKSQSGTVHLDGLRTDELKPHEIAVAGLSRTFQNIRLMGELSVLDNVRLPRRSRPRTSPTATSAASRSAAPSPPSPRSSSSMSPPPA
jgi:branched-chain amino acid transport system ATP-binding protein